jgi:hypothetical protein
MRPIRVVGADHRSRPAEPNPATGAPPGGPESGSCPGPRPPPRQAVGSCPPGRRTTRSRPRTRQQPLPRRPGRRRPPQAEELGSPVHPRKPERAASRHPPGGWGHDRPGSGPPVMGRAFGTARLSLRRTRWPMPGGRGFGCVPGWDRFASLRCERGWR